MKPLLFSERIVASAYTGEEAKFYTNDTLVTGTEYEFTPNGIGQWVYRDFLNNLTNTTSLTGVERLIIQKSGIPMRTTIQTLWDNAPFYTITEINDLLDDKADVTDLDGYIQSVTGSGDITVDNTDPQNPVISFTSPDVGDVDGPASSVDDNVVTFNGTTGKLIQDSGIGIASLVTLANAQTITGLKTISLGTAVTAQNYLSFVPTDYDTGKPALYILKDSVADTWQIGLWDDVDNTGTIDIAASSFTWNGNPIIVDTALDTALLDYVQGVTGTGDITVDNTDPQNPIISYTGSAGSGDVVGPASSVDNRIVTFDGITGKLIQDSGYVVGDFATAAQGSLADSALQNSDIGTSVQGYDADTAKTDVASQWTAPQRSEITALTSGTTITPDLANSNDFSLTLGHNATLANPTNQSTYVGLKGSIACVNDGTGGYTLSYDSFWYPIGATVAPLIPTGANAKFRIDFHVVSSTRIDFAVSGVGV